MNRRIVLLSLIFILGQSLTIAQDTPTLITSKVTKDSKKLARLDYSLADGAGGVVIVRSFYGGSLIKKLQGYYIQHFDQHLRLRKEMDYEVDGSVISNAFVRDGKVHFIEQKLNDESLDYDVVALSLKSFKPERKHLLSYPREEISEYYNLDAATRYYVLASPAELFNPVVMSENNNYFLINLDHVNAGKRMHRMFVFNANCEKVNEQLVNKESVGRKFVYKSIDVDDQDGTVYLLGKSYAQREKGDKKSEIDNPYFELYRIDGEGQEKTKFETTDQFIHSLKVVKTAEQLNCVGFYGEQSAQRSNGVCFFKLNADNLKIIDTTYSPFSPEFFTDKFGDQEKKKSRKQEKGIPKLWFKGVETAANGDLIINAEERYITYAVVKTTNGGLRDQPVYHYDDIVTVRISENGDLKWSKSINKKQKGQSGVSYAHLSLDEETFFFITGAINAKKKRSGRFAIRQSGARSSLYLVKIDAAGNVTHEELIDGNKTSIYYNTRNGVANPSARNMTLMGSEGKKSQVMKIQF